MTITDLRSGVVLVEREDNRASVITDKMGMALHHYASLKKEVTIVMKNNQGIKLAETDTKIPKKKYKPNGLQ